MVIFTNISYLLYVLIYIYFYPYVKCQVRTIEENNAQLAKEVSFAYLSI